MLNLGSNIFNTEAIFLQPTYMCAKDCEGCYVKENEKLFGNKNMGELWFDLIRDLFWNQTYIDANQITLAVDSLSTEHKENIDFMTRILRAYLIHSLDSKDEGNSKNKTINITVNTLSDIYRYMGMSIKNFSEGIDLVSVSYINNKKEVAELRALFPNAKINWNVLSSSIVNKSLDDIKNILQVVDQMYLLLHKAPTGHQGHGISDFIRALSKVNQLKLDTSHIISDGISCDMPSLISKIVPDHCMTDSVHSIKTGFGCSANISRFQIWPDGTVTGCAYNSQNKYGKPAETMNDILNNLKDARSRYEFKDLCTIPDSLKSNKYSLPIVQ